MKALLLLPLLIATAVFCDGHTLRRDKRATIPKFKFGDNLSHRECGYAQGNDDRAWLVKIEVPDDLEKKYCFGSVISNHYIVTAAFCLESVEDPSQIKVSFAKHDFRSNHLSPVKTFSHPDFELETLRANVAVLQFDTDLVTNGVLPICLWNKNIEGDGQLITESEGIASVPGKEVSSDKIVVGKFKVAEVSDCKKKISSASRAFFDFSNLCLEYQEGLSTCVKGFGAPMQFKIGDRWFLRGIYNAGFKTSGAEKCQNYRIFSFTDAARYVEFITGNSDVKLENEIASSIIKPKNNRSYPNCGILHKNEGTALIYNGKTAKLRDHPWSAALFKVYTTNMEYSCAGSLISDKFILTAAHCVYENGLKVADSRLIVALGKEQLSGGWTRDAGVQIHSVKHILPHNEYKASDKDIKYDIALLELNLFVQFSPIISPICLWHNTIDLNALQGRNGTVAGWGLLANYAEGNVLQELELPIHNKDTCSRIEGKESFYARKMRTSPAFCAGFLNKGMSPCNGDSGAALVVEEGGLYYVRGVVSETIAVNVDGAKFCNADYPAIFTDVAGYREWIRKETRNEIKFDYVQ